jgi:hypothetical protein
LGHPAVGQPDVVIIVIGSECKIGRQFNNKIFHGLKPVVIINTMLIIVIDGRIEIEDFFCTEAEIAVEIKIIHCV